MAARLTLETDFVEFPFWNRPLDIPSGMGSRSGSPRWGESGRCPSRTSRCPTAPPAASPLACSTSFPHRVSPASPLDRPVPGRMRGDVVSRFESRAGCSLHKKKAGESPRRPVDRSIARPNQALQLSAPLPGWVSSTDDGSPVIFQPPSAVYGSPALSALSWVGVPSFLVRTTAILSPSKKVT